VVGLEARGAVRVAVIEVVVAHAGLVPQGDRLAEVDGQKAECTRQ